ncbi:MAG TPA: CaiB/BaiF CoA-transferase family protein [Mycobacteriales bacterium]|nr:CaiB/BaiF CoA-transferase family protein [Mycobacteriales bacterium]
MSGLLDGMTVLDLASVGPAVRASGWLADYGAEVIKVGPVPTDAGVQIVPKPHYYSGGRGTRRVLIDLKSASGREAFLTLAAHADVLIESYRPGVVERLGISYDDVKGRNRGIVYCSTSGYGQTGERALWAGHDLNYLAVSGYLACSEPTQGGKPPIPGTTIADIAGGGLHAVVAILAALVARASTGEGAYLDVAVADGMLALMSLQLDDVLATGAEQLPATAPLSGRYACYDVYPTADDGWVAVAAIEAKFWANLCRALGVEEWIDAQYDDTVQDAARAALTSAFRTRTRDDWVAMLAPADTCVSPVLSAREAAGDTSFAARGVYATACAPTSETWQQVAPLFAGAERAERYDLPDRSVTDTETVLARCGLAEADIARLIDEGAIA